LDQEEGCIELAADAMSLVGGAAEELTGMLLAEACWSVTLESWAVLVNDFFKLGKSWDFI
jgi:hypothetical protein